MSWADRVASLALQVIADPAASAEERAEARSAAMGERLDPRHLTRDERLVFGHLIRRALGQAVDEAPLESLIGRRADQVAADRLAAMTIADHLAAIIALDPTGEQVRRFAEQDPETPEQGLSKTEQSQSAI